MNVRSTARRHAPPIARGRDDIQDKAVRSDNAGTRSPRSRGGHAAVAPAPARRSSESARGRGRSTGSGCVSHLVHRRLLVPRLADVAPDTRIPRAQFLPPSATPRARRIRAAASSRCRSRAPARAPGQCPPGGIRSGRCCRTRWSRAARSRHASVTFGTPKIAHSSCTVPLSDMTAQRTLLELDEVEESERTAAASA